MIVARITDLFNKIIADPAYSDMKKVKSLIGLARNKTLDYKQLMFVCQLLPFLTEQGLLEVEKRFDDLITALKSQIIKQDCTWQKVMKAFEFQPEIKKIEQFFVSRIDIDEVSPTEATEEIKREIITCINQNECEFDL